jgi:hypothetical protein
MTAVDSPQPDRGVVGEAAQLGLVVEGKAPALDEQVLTVIHVRSERPSAMRQAQHGEHVAGTPGAWRMKLRDSETGTAVGSAARAKRSRFTSCRSPKVASFSRNKLPQRRRTADPLNGCSCPAPSGALIDRAVETAANYVRPSIPQQSWTDFVSRPSRELDPRGGSPLSSPTSPCSEEAKWRRSHKPTRNAC